MYRRSHAYGTHHMPSQEKDRREKKRETNRCQPHLHNRRLEMNQWSKQPHMNRNAPRHDKSRWRNRSQQATPTSCEPPYDRRHQRHTNPNVNTTTPGQCRHRWSFNFTTAHTAHNVTDIPSCNLPISLPKKSLTLESPRTLLVECSAATTSISLNRYIVTCVAALL